ncbi:MAG: lipid A export permease/ATP-binding protein MsbA, partial [Gammaproteobacteria bacterium]|nr:lipid A export permease/ATP-binding protein MsbA [Gammaproteobacteria bacterium]
VANKVVMDLRVLMVHKLISLPAVYYDNNATGNLMSKVTYDVTQVTSAATNVLIVLVRDILTVAGLLGWMVYLNWKLSVVALLVAPVIALSIRMVSLRLRGLGQALQKTMGDMNHILEEAISNNKVVKVFGGQTYEAGRFREVINWARRYAVKMTSTSTANVQVVQFIAVLALTVIIYFASFQSAANQITVGGFVSFMGAMAMLFSPIKRLTRINEQLQRGLAAAESVFTLIDEASEPDRGTVAIGRAKGGLEFRHVGMTYPGRGEPSLKNINLSIAAGETVAIVGASGSGKTTLVNLIPRFYHPTTGQILLDGVDIETLRLADLRANVALVGQDVVLFNDTVAANIAYGPLSGAPEAEIIAAAEAAHAMEYIEKLENGLQTLIGEDGVRLSGGQRQRLAIARAILKKAPILLLDEATSSLDTESERHIQAALNELRKDHTMIIIAHRLSTIEHADRIVVMQNGEIVETGTHAALLKKNGVYANLYRSQFTPALIKHAAGNALS